MDLEVRRERFQSFYSEFSKSILHYAMRRTKSREEASDIVAETFLVAWSKIDSVPKGKEGVYWLYAVARRILANEYRKDINQKKLGDGLRQHLISAEALTFDEQSNTKLIVSNALSSLSSDEFEIITLANWEGLKSREIGKIMGIPAVTVRTRLNRIRTKLKIMLEEKPEFIEHLTNSEHSPIQTTQIVRQEN